MLDVQSLVKYLLEGVATAAAAFYLTQKKTDIKEVLMIALVAAATFAVLDQFAPGVSAGARQGAGFGIGQGLVGGGQQGQQVQQPQYDGFDDLE